MEASHADVNMDATSEDMWNSLSLEYAEEIMALFEKETSSEMASRATPVELSRKKYSSDFEEVDAVTAASKRRHHDAFIQKRAIEDKAAENESNAPFILLDFDERNENESQSKDAPRRHTSDLCDSRDRHQYESHYDSRRSSFGSTAASMPVSGGVSKGSRSRGSRSGPSKFCHVCWNDSVTRRKLICTNYGKSKGSCRKVICEVCVQKHLPSSEWPGPDDCTITCTHCRGSCPEKSQCSIYNKTNLKKRISKTGVQA
mmetsp:Transcript_14424/g.31045  ORF Transcript_14424/g.31045 Transcript_14424/m.31045 type:complete len:258 (-) Transcript_14424:102-875(-)